MKTTYNPIDNFGLNLDRIVDHVDEIHKVPKGSLDPGDYVFVKTVNSMYSICKRDNDLFEVRGGWFDRKGLSPAILSITGCTWGGSIINLGIIAARGLFIEFSNKLITSPLRKIVVIRARQLN